MTLLNYSVFAQTIAPAFLNSEKTYITQQLFGFLASHPDIQNKNGESYYIDNQTASKWWNQRAPIPFTIRKAVQRPDVEQTIINDFDAGLWSVLSEDKLDKPLNQLVALIKEQQIDEDVKTELINLRKDKNLNDFLAKTFILAVRQSDNKEEQIVEIEPMGTNKKSAPADAKDIIFKKIFLDNSKPYVDLKEAYLKGAFNSDPDPNFLIKQLLKSYLQKATDYYSKKKTLIHKEKPLPFNDIYVCSNLRYHVSHPKSVNDSKASHTFSDATIQQLEAESQYIIIEGIGGIGKSMYLTYLFLSSTKAFFAETFDKFPIFIPLKDYKKTMANMTEFIWLVVSSYVPEITKEQVLTILKNKKMVLLLDGFDEITSSAKASFNNCLESFIRAYPGNTVIMTSRPVNSFVSYTSFTLLDIQPLTKPQALALIDKLEWNKHVKQEFKKKLDSSLYAEHMQFASNPLLLTIMLMTFNTYAEIPAKMHVFYSMAYETMSRTHDATKEAFVRPLYTGLTPEDFAKRFSEFCARTYVKEIFEFTEHTFSSYMESVINKPPFESKAAPRDYLLDLTDNLCIMYREGDNYYFIHRSFQEYFAALYFSSVYDSKLPKIGNYFESSRNRSNTDRTFDMLYDMIPEKVERFIFLPFLQGKFDEWNGADANETYWNFLEDQYPVIYYEDEDTPCMPINSPQSFLYHFIGNVKNILFQEDLDVLNWPQEVFDMTTNEWVAAYRAFTKQQSYDTYPDFDSIPEEVLDDVITIDKADLPYEYSEYFGEPEVEGRSVEIDIFDIRKNREKYASLMRFIESNKFPIREEFEKLKNYYDNLQSQLTKESKSVGLFDD